MLLYVSDHPYPSLSIHYGSLQNEGPPLQNKYTHPTTPAFSFHYQINTPNPVAAYKMLGSEPQGLFDQTPLLPNDHSVGGLTPCML